MALRLPYLAVVLLVACGPTVQTAPTPPVTPAVPPPPVVVRATVRPDATYRLPPAIAMQRGLMPLSPTGVPGFRQAHPTWDGRGVLIAIMDSGIDPYVEGLQTTSTGDPKLVDLRDFSNEGRIALAKVTPQGDAVTIGGKTLTGFGRLLGFNANGPWYAGTLREVGLGKAPAADVNWNNVVGDTLAVLVTKASDGWILIADLDGDGSLSNDKPIHDYLVARERFGWAPPGRSPMLGFAANFSEQAGEPVLDLFFDASGHGTHVAGIASGSKIYGVAGFDGVAPGAEILGLKIGNDAQGGITTPGSMVSALDYAIRAAAQRKKPLVINMSFGVGNEEEGTAVIDAIIDSVMTAHPDVVFAISAGNDGPGLSTLGFPGSADRVLSVGATFPRAFLTPDAGAALDPIAYFSSRGGEVARPDLLTPGVAFSTKPNWARGDEVDGGTSMASPHAAGLAALLVSALAQNNKPVVATRVKQALITTAQPIDGLTTFDQGNGVPDVGRAWRWLESDRRWTPLVARATGDVARGSNSAFRSTGLRNAGDTTQTFTLSRTDGGTTAVDVTLKSDAPWLIAPAKVTLRGATTTVTLRYRAAAVSQPGLYVGTVTVWGSDTTAGPIARLVNGIDVPVASSSIFEAPTATIGAGLERRWAFGTVKDRPFEVRIASGTQKDVITGFLYEPGGQPFRGGHEVEGASGDDAAVFRLDARDVIGGVYEAVVAAPPISASSAGIKITQAPFTMLGSKSGDDALLGLGNQTETQVVTAVTAAIVGGVHNETLSGIGADTGRLSFALPAWVRRVEIDVQMGVGEWVKFTDFGVTLEDANGAQLGQGPLNYAFGRLEADLPARFAGTTAQLRLYPAWTRPGSSERWATTVQVRLYADPSTATVLAPKASATVTLAPRSPDSATFTAVTAAWELPQGFLPLIRYEAKVGESDPWTVEAPLATARMPLMR